MLAEEIAGFRHDDDNPEFDAFAFEVLIDRRPNLPWWKRWC